MKLSIHCYKDIIQFILNNKLENGEFEKFGKKFTLNELKRLSKWFILFDSINEVARDIIKLNITINIKENNAKLTFKTNMAKIKDFDIILEKEEFSKDEVINNLRNEIKELKKKLNANNDFGCSCCFLAMFLLIIILYLFAFKQKPNDTNILKIK